MSARHYPGEYLIKEGAPAFAAPSKGLVGSHLFCSLLYVVGHVGYVADVFEADGLGLELGELDRGNRVGCLLEHAHGLKVVLGNVEA